MLRRILITVCFLGLTFWIPATDSVEVIVVKTRLCKQPDFLSATVAGLQRGDRLVIIKSAGGWARVKTLKNLVGYVHETAFTRRKVKLTGIKPGSQSASRNEIALAAKGFNKGNERVLRGRKGFNFRDLDWIFQRTVSTSELRNFVKQGKLR